MLHIHEQKVFAENALILKIFTRILLLLSTACHLVLIIILYATNPNIIYTLKRTVLLENDIQHGLVNYIKTE